MQNFFRVIIASVVLIPSLTAEEEPPQFSAKQLEFFESKVRPLLVQHCYDCHSTDAKKLKAALYVDSREGILKGGDSGPAVTAGKPNESLLIDAVKYKSFEMPPDGKLQSEQIAALERWVKMGAPWPAVTTTQAVTPPEQMIDWDTARQSHWAWQPVERPEIPQIADKDNLQPIDALAAVERSAAGLTPSLRAPSAVLARRMYLDLVGIPPTPTQVEEFVAASKRNPQHATVELVEQLLASPLYGQRWGRHWLDVARYSDGFGGFLDNAALPDAWRYRDWVVEAFNADMPYDEFIRLQLTGDMTGRREDAIATGFLALGPTYRSDGGDPDSVAQARGETLDDRVDTVTRGLLGITGSCARCHDHKFDPIPQKDYYSLAGIFNNTDVQILPLAPDDDVRLYNDHIAKEQALEKQIRELKKNSGKESEASDVPQKENLLSELKSKRPQKYDTCHALRDARSDDMKIALRGNLRKQGEVAPRRFLRIIAGADPPLFRDGSGRRELADAILDPANPLTARVFVNRIWSHHFGDGIVRSAGNFGRLGERPTHPQLLDWLAAEFMECGWSVKHMHRLIMTSHVYQQSSAMRSSAFAADGDNRLLWRMNPRRMDVEAWRDSLLHVTGELDTSAGGPPLDDITASPRRTLYAKVSRNGDVFASDTFLRRFDFPLMRATVSERPTSIVPQQFLFLLNSRFMLDRAKAFDARLRSAAESDRDRIILAYRLLYGRAPAEDEIDLGLSFLAEPAQDQKLTPSVQYAQVLLSSNEFMFVR